MDRAQRTILHVDMDAFFASIEQLDHPEWRGLPVIVGAPPDRRGVVAAASYEARRFGVRSAMPSREAGRLCPHGIFVRPRMRRYEEMSRRAMAIFEGFTPLVEVVSIDEAALDVTGGRRLWGDGEATARRIKAAIRDELGLTASVGVAPNRFLAKLASDLQKPDGLTVVPDDAAGIRAFLAPLPLSRLWGVGEATNRRLREAGLTTIGDVQQAGPDGLAPLVGRATAVWLFELAQGHDDRPVGEPGPERSLSREHTFETDCESPDCVEATLLELADDVGRRTREGGWYAGVARIKIRWAPFRTVLRQQRLDPPACDDFVFRDAARRLWRRSAPEGPVRLIGFGVADLTRQPPPTELFDETAGGRIRRERLSRVVDDINRRYGPGAVGRLSAAPPPDD